MVPKEFYADGRLVRFGELYYRGELGWRPWGVAFRLPEGTVLRVPFDGDQYVIGFAADHSIQRWESDWITVGSVYEGGYGFKDGLVLWVSGPALHFPSGPTQGEWVRRGEVLAVVTKPARELPIPGLRDYNVLLEFSAWTGSENGLHFYGDETRALRQFFPYLLPQR